MRDFFDRRGFVEVETPIVVASPGLDLHLDAFEVLGASGPRWLSTSPEYHMKRLLSEGMNAIYQLTKSFRRDEVGTLHAPEFTMLEWYRAGAGSEDVMEDTEMLLSEVATTVHGTTRLPPRSADEDAPVVDVSPPWDRVRVEQALADFAGVALQEVLPDEERFFRLWVEHVEPHLGAGKPIFVTHYPASMASLARLHAGDARFADRFELYVSGIELCNGFSELTDPVEQRQRLERDQRKRQQEGKDVYPIDERFVQALERGIPPSGGNALGIDRLLMLLLGAPSIADVMAFTDTYCL